MTSSPPPNLVSVKSMISIFENQSYVVNSEPTRLKQRTKSVENVNDNVKSPRLRKHSERRNSPEREEKNLELAQIAQQIQHLQRSLNNYKTYSRDNHIYYQNQIFFLLTDLVNVETKNQPHVVNEKSEMIELLKRLNKGLITRLPSAGKKQKTEFPLPKISKVAEERPKAVQERPKPVQERSKSVEERPKPVQERPKPVEERPEPVRERPTLYEKQETIEVEDETPVLSVKSLKKLFERENDPPREVPKAKVSRAFMSFNGTDTKYIPYSQRFKSKEAESATYVIQSTSSNLTQDTELSEKSVSKQSSVDEQDEDGVMNGKAEDSSSSSSSSDTSDGTSSSDSDDETDKQEGNS